MSRLKRLILHWTVWSTRFILLWRDMKILIITGTAAIAQSAATMLRDEVNAESIGHVASPALDESATKSVRRDIGHDGWGFGDGPGSISAPIESASLALYAARTTRRDPQRVQEASF